MTTASAPVRPPLQARSRRTLERILDATESLLENQRFEDLTVAAIVARARTSVGAFYTRFRDKDALLPALYARYDSWVGDEAQRTRAGSPPQGADLRETCAWIVHQLARLFAARRNLMRAMALHARQRPEKIDAETRARRGRELSFLREALLARRDEIGHPAPERAVDFALFFTAAAVRERLLFGDAPHAESTGMRERELEPELVRLMLGYLG